MKIIFKALLYTGLVLTANLAAPNLAHAENLNDLRTGDMRKLVLHENPRDVSMVEFLAPDGGASLKDYAGKIVVVNFWALWCAPCREEMPTLEKLAQEFDPEEFAVVTVATGPNAPPAINAFFEEIQVTTLPKYRDPQSRLARASGVLGLPVTLILNREGREIARMTGTANWHSESAQSIVKHLISKKNAS